jgi:hypothetical protein
MADISKNIKNTAMPIGPIVSGLVLNMIVSVTTIDTKKNNRCSVLLNLVCF